MRFNYNISSDKYSHFIQMMKIYMICRHFSIIIILFRKSGIAGTSRVLASRRKRQYNYTDTFVYIIYVYI